MRLHKLLQQKPFSLVASLSANDLDLAKAALDGGADAIKVHMNVFHVASQSTFGSFADNATFLEKLLELAGDRPVGAVLGGGDAFITPAEKQKLEALGLDFFSCYAEHLPAFMLQGDKLTKMVALHDTYETILPAVADSEIQVVEASIMHPSAYGTPLTYFDLLQYRKICQSVSQPVLIPTQKRIQPGEVFALRDAGCRAIMIGAVVVGESTPQAWLQATTAYRRAIDQL